ncbi:MAG: S8 family serine peptidase [Archangium sp.]
MSEGKGGPVWFHAGDVVKALDTKRQPIQVPGPESETLTLTGKGETIAVYDSGLDCGESRGKWKGLTLRNFDPQRVKFLHPKENTVDFGDYSGHGTHVAGTIAHLAQGEPAGIARDASLLIQNQGETCSPKLYLESLERAVDNGATLHNNSWAEEWFWKQPRHGAGEYVNSKTTSGTNPVQNTRLARYDEFCAVADAFASEQRAFTIVAGASNEGPQFATIGAPGAAKNVLTVGSCRNGVPYGGAPAYMRKETDNPDAVPLPPLYSHELSVFSSRGPTDDGRIKPDLVAPGECIYAPYSQLTGQGVCGGEIIGGRGIKGEFCYSNGTSMATPVASGTTALLRQWLRERHDIKSPSSALLKALLINGAERLPNAGGWGSIHQGWGRLNLENVVDPKGGTFVHWSDEKQPLAQGESAELEFDVPGRPFKVPRLLKLKITLVWIDPPAKPIDKPGVQVLINDLDLSMIDPKSNLFVGNQFDRYRRGSQRLADWQQAKPDAINNVECIIVDEAISSFLLEKGRYKVRVTARKVAQSSVPSQAQTTPPAQSFALVISANFDLPSKLTWQVLQGGNS